MGRIREFVEYVRGDHDPRFVSPERRILEYFGIIEARPVTLDEARFCAVIAGTHNFRRRQQGSGVTQHLAKRPGVGRGAMAAVPVFPGGTQGTKGGVAAVAGNSTSRAGWSRAVITARLACLFWVSHVWPAVRQTRGHALRS